MTVAAAPARPFSQTARTLRRMPTSLVGSIIQLGDFVLFSGRAIASVFSELLLRRRFFSEVARQISAVAPSPVRAPCDEHPA